MSDCLSLLEQYFAPGMENANAPEWALHLQECPSCHLAYDGLPEVDRGLAEMAKLPVSVPPFDTVAGAAQAAARHQRRRQVVRRSVPFFYTGMATAAVAAGIVVAVMIGRGRAASPKLLQPGAEIQATAEAKSAVLSNGVRIRLEAGTVKLVSASIETQMLYLSSGRISVDVPKLPRGSTLALRTPDAEVRVHGTRFQVIRTGKDTQVHVAEGVVEVRPEGFGRPIQFVNAGESLTVGSVEAYREGLRSSTLAALDHGEFVAAEKKIEDLLGTSADRPQQAEAQALLAWSLSARGRRGEAIQRYQQALSLLPETQQPLWAENACAELAILEQQERPEDASHTWAECLRRFPNGVHAALARSRVRSTKGM